jgi:hypothetical protein
MHGMSGLGLRFYWKVGQETKAATQGTRLGATFEYHPASSDFYLFL